MSKISSLLNVGQRSMMNSQTAIQTVGHNIANKETQGFSRQRVEMISRPPVGHERVQIGMGASTSGVRRTNNPYLEKQLEKEGSELAYNQSLSTSLARVEDIYNEQINKGLNEYLGEFFNALREFSNNPESLAYRSHLKESADFLANDFKRIDESLEDVKGDLDEQVKTEVHKINEILSEIASLNMKIQSAEMTVGEANDNRDRRDQLIKNLGEKIGIKYVEGDGGKTTVMSAGVVLVSGFDFRPLEVYNPADHMGRSRIYFRSTDQADPADITDRISGGSISAALHVRDAVVKEVSSDMDEMAFRLSHEMNEIHRNGFDQYQKTGRDFFVPIKDKQGAASLMSLNQEIKVDVGKIAGAGFVHAPADNTIANLMANLEYKTFMGNGNSTISDFYGGIVSRVGLSASRANSRVESQSSLVQQLKNVRESVSGVSIDEEMTKLLEFQKSYDASARVIRTADELLDTVLRLKPI